jgi:hypothetical protein
MNRAKMDFDRARALLDEVNSAIAGYDEVLKERARDILLETLFDGQATPGSPSPDRPDEATESAALADDDFSAMLRRWSPHRAS